MTFKAIVYDTQNGEPMETTVRCIHCSKNGKPERLTAHNGMQYMEFKILNAESIDLRYQKICEEYLLTRGIKMPDLEGLYNQVRNLIDKNK